jgi:hypothetical protein
MIPVPPRPYTADMRYLLAIVVTALLAGGGVYYWQTQLQPSGRLPAQAGGGFGGAQSAALVTVTPVRRETLFDTIQAIGTAQATTGSGMENPSIKNVTMEYLGWNPSINN